MYYKSKQLALSLIKAVEENPKEEKKIIDNFLKFCQKKKIIQQFKNILKNLEELVRQKAEVDNFIIESKNEIGKNTIDDIKKLIGVANGEEPELRIKDNIQGGFIAKYKGKVYDGSVKGQLLKLKMNLK